MKTHLLLLGCFLMALWPSLASAPNPEPDLKDGSVEGTVIDQGLGQPVAYAAVVIKTAPGTGEPITGGITTEEGQFHIEKLPEGKYLLEVQFIGYQTYSIPFEISKEDKKVRLGTISLKEATMELSGVEVVGERTTIEQKTDRKVVNVGRDLTTTGATAAEIMNNIPSLNVDQQTGELSLRGNTNVRVMVDGKLSNVPVEQLLRQIPSTSIKAIELITNPSAKYNPEGMSGLINIILHKNANIGFNGNLNLGLTKGIEAKFNSSVDLNYRQGKVNLYGSYGNNIGKYVNDGHIFRPVENSLQEFDFLNNNKSHLYKAGIDIYLNDRHTLSVFTNQNLFDSRGNGGVQVTYADSPSRNTALDLLTLNDNRSEQYNLDYKWEFPREGHSLELEFDHNRYTSQEDADFRSTGAATLPDYTDFVDIDRLQTIANLDYVIPLDTISKLEAGLEARVFETEVGYRSTGLSFTPEGTLVPTPSTEFTYGMDIYSAYATYGRNYERWSFQAGLRLEDVEVQADTNGVRSFTDEYTQLYPSAFLTYTPGEKNQYQLSYSRRVDRPGLTQVNPIREFATPLISSFGNPELLPQFTDSYEANYTRRFKIGSLTAGVFYRAIQDEINRAVFVDRLDLNRMILTYDNFDDTSAYGVEVSGNLKATSWWSINMSFDLYQQTQRGRTERLLTDQSNATVDDIVVVEQEVDNTAWNLRMNNSLKATENLTFQVFGFYRGQNRTIQLTADPMYFVNLGARYSFAQGKGSVSVNFNDVFNTMRFAFDADEPFIQSGQFNWESQNLFVGLSYRFGSGKNQTSGRKNRDRNTKEGSGGLF
ncbi:TonB-dependent receptor domain-containing protein [Robiginitalea marina]|uniref:TonB-dependent receptor n=1 Tax=Robiginitalea marina TaxID=2954105 RepID=A0ABT1AZL7_9FLAO|nr:outer membrane beta-barrel family protein [Robiginitalea marina]MCO5725494.1 TonB-dependent receptor [Robiginitalea marina]